LSRSTGASNEETEKPKIRSTLRSNRRFSLRKVRDGEGDFSLSEQHIKRNLVIFMTARLVNPGRQLVNSNDETEESENIIEPPILPEVPFSKK